MSAARRAWLAVAVLPLLMGAGDDGNPSGETSCIACHSQLEDEVAESIASSLKADVHAVAGIGCHDCHGGDPSPALADDVEAMSEDRGFRSSPGRLDVPDFCGKCHSDAQFMKKFNPQVRVDQLTEYRTSTHGKRNASGDETPAVCTDCHGFHGMLPVTSPNSPVFATNVPETCARCHSDEAVMGPYNRPTDPYDLFTQSVHGAALLERGDTAAPSCNDCHGNHGAAPPGVESVSLVCGQCHGRESMLFRASFKHELFNELDVPECSVCHDHHLILHPTPALFYSGSEPMVTQGRVRDTRPFVAELGELEAGTTAEVEWTGVIRMHLEGDDPRFDEMIAITSEASEVVVIDATLRPGDRPIAAPPRTATADGLTVELTMGSISGDPVRAGDAVRYKLRVTSESGAALPDVTVAVVSSGAVDTLPGSACLNCHEIGDVCDVATGKMYESLLSLEREVRAASDLLNTAEMRGMEVAGEQFKLRSSARTAIQEGRALLHSFEPDKMIARAEEGRVVAAEAIEAGDAALDEFQYRRAGLAVSLVFVLLVLVALYLKIREVDRARDEA